MQEIVLFTFPRRSALFSVGDLKIVDVVWEVNNFQKKERLIDISCITIRV